MDMPMPQPNNHGFSLLGKKSLVLSHIPMFMAPHQAQLFLEVTLSGSGQEDPTKIYLDDQAKTKTTNYVLVTDPIVLPNLAPHAAKRITSFTGKLYRGWPFNNPNDAPVLVEKLTVHVTRSIYFHDITKGKLLTELTYLAFASPETEYLVHKLVQPPDLAKAPKPPDFVQILSAKGMDAAQLHDVKELCFPGVNNNLKQRLNAGQKTTGEINGKKVHVDTQAELIYDPNHLTM
ncbi:MAG TPA: hypothetical protein VIB39_17800 [Candidatus Angelobacter sp.]|jgi:hypothetical protein